MVLVSMLFLVSSLIMPLYALSIEVKTDKEFYTIGEPVKVQGKVSEVSEGFAIAIQILDPDNSIWAIDQASPAVDGTFSSTVATVSKGSPLGEYTVKASYKGVSAETKFKVIAKLFLTIPKDVYSYGEKVNVKVEGSKGDRFTLEYSRDKANWKTIADESFATGSAYVNWTPPFTGKYFLRAKLLDRANNLLGQSDTYELTVNPQILNFIAHREDDKVFSVKIVANSSLQDFKFSIEKKEIAFTSSSAAFALVKMEIIIPLLLLDGQYSTSIAGKEITFSENRNQTHATLSIQYISDGSPQSIRILGTTVIPEFPGLALLIILTLSLLVLGVIQKRFR